VETLRSIILEYIRQKGPLTFELFMEMALYCPEMGYYMKEKNCIGKDGDYYTSPHVHPFFGASIARQIIEMWELIDKPESFTIVEVGPGRGFLCLDILTYLKDWSFFSVVDYKLVELNPYLKGIQKRRLEKFSSLIEWYETLSDIVPFKGCVIAHEIVDSFPVHVIEKTRGGEMTEIYVAEERGEFQEIKMPISRELTEYFSERNIILPCDYRSEVNLKLQHWVNQVASVITKGFLFVCDYGYSLDDFYAPQRNQGTLLCYYKHQQRDDPFKRVGEQDITSHVNFFDLKKWGESVGLKPVGFCSQMDFLIAMGIDEMISSLDSDEREYIFEIGRVKNLLLSTGQSHSVMIQSKALDSIELKGFSVRNQLDYL
jgi:SAM-dependent MidA family methyltransferase